MDDRLKFATLKATKGFAKTFLRAAGGSPEELFDGLKRHFSPDDEEQGTNYYKKWGINYIEKAYAESESGDAEEAKEELRKWLEKFKDSKYYTKYKKYLDISEEDLDISGSSDMLKSLKNLRESDKAGKVLNLFNVPESGELRKHLKNLRKTRSGSAQATAFFIMTLLAFLINGIVVISAILRSGGVSAILRTDALFGVTLIVAALIGLGLVKAGSR